MKLEIKNQLNKYFHIKNEKLVNKILWSIKWRQECYWEVWFSRHEFDKFNTSEKVLREVIDNLRQNWLLVLKWKRKSNNNKFLCNVYEISYELKQILSLLRKSIEFLNEKIIQWNKESNLSQILNWYWFQTFRNGRIWTKKSNITYNKRTNCVSDWQLWTHYNLFNFLKFALWISTIDLILTQNIW